MIDLDALKRAALNSRAYSDMLLVQHRRHERKELQLPPKEAVS